MRVYHREYGATKNDIYFEHHDVALKMVVDEL